jgi:hypothetical protein
VQQARALGLEVIDRCNLTVLLEPGQEDLARFLADHQVRGRGQWLAGAGWRSRRRPHRFAAALVRAPAPAALARAQGEGV